MRMSRVLGAAMLSGVMVMVGCASSDGAGEGAAASAEPVNGVCPIGGHAITAESPRVAYKGTTIAFCCNGCAEGFADMSEPERDAVLATARSGG